MFELVIYYISTKYRNYSSETLLIIKDTEMFITILSLIFILKHHWIQDVLLFRFNNYNIITSAKNVYNLAKKLNTRIIHMFQVN